MVAAHNLAERGICGIIGGSTGQTADCISGPCCLSPSESRGGGIEQGWSMGGMVPFSHPLSVARLRGVGDSTLMWLQRRPGGGGVFGIVHSVLFFGGEGYHYVHT